MKRLDKKGFSAVEAVLLFIIIIAIAGVGYYIYKAKKNTDSTYNNTANASTVTKSTAKPKTTTDPYAGWKTGTLQYEKITYRYPSNWTLKDSSMTKADANNAINPVGCTLDNGTDLVLLTAPSGATVTFSTGQECHSGAKTGSYVGFTPISVLGSNDYIAYENTLSDSNTVVAATISTSSSVGYDYPLSVNIKGSNNPWNQFIYTPNGTINVNSGVALSDFEKNPDLATATLIFKSLKYQ